MGLEDPGFVLGQTCLAEYSGWVEIGVEPSEIGVEPRFPTRENGDIPNLMY